MRVAYNVLSEDILDKCENFLENINDKPVWSVSEFFWDDSIKENVIGLVTMTNIHGSLKEEILECIDEYVLPYTGAEVQLYVWHRSASIAMHDDNGRYGCTIYLNKEWDINCGGLFVWESPDGLRALNPTYNMMVLNSDQEEHMVTPVSPYAEDFRYTIQIWFVPDTKRL